jgi:hypothetical protein
LLLRDDLGQLGGINHLDWHMPPILGPGSCRGCCRGSLSSGGCHRCTLLGPLHKPLLLLLLLLLLLELLALLCLCMPCAVMRPAACGPKLGATRL